MSNEAHVYWFSTDDTSIVEGKAFGALDPSERKQYRGLRNSQNAGRFARRRAARRLILSSHLGTPTSELTFGSSEHGKPFLRDAPAPVEFSTSSSADLGVVAITSDGQIGVDVECARPIRAELLSRSILAPAEHAEYQHLPASDREQWMLRRWTIKEAIVKALGTGLSLSALPGVDTSQVAKDDTPFPVPLSGAYAGRAPLLATAITPVLPGRPTVFLALACTVPLSVRLHDASCILRGA